MGRKKQKKRSAASKPDADAALEFTHQGSSAGFVMMVMGFAWVVLAAWSQFLSDDARPTLGSFPIVLVGTLPVLIGGFVALTRSVRFHRQEGVVRVSRQLLFFRWAEAIPFKTIDKIWIWSPKPGSKEAERRHELIMTGPYSVLLERGEPTSLRATGEAIARRTGIAFAGVESA